LSRVRALERDIVRLLDDEIDRRVYVLYGLTEAEIKIVEGNYPFILPNHIHSNLSELKIQQAVVFLILSYTITLWGIL